MLCYNVCITKSDLLNIVRWNALRDPRLLDISPSIPSILSHKHESLALSHAPFSIAPGIVVVQSFDILQLLGSSLGSYRRALLLRCSLQTSGY